MKKLSRIIILLLGVFVLFMFENVKASVSSTVFIGDSITIDKLDLVEVTSNDICIDINTSKVTNDFLIKNTNNEELITKITAKLEDESSNFSIKDLVIKVNNLQIKNIEKDNDNYSFFIKIKPEEYEKIEISYSTENDLKNAKIIKYNLDSFKGKKVKKFNFDVKIPEEDVPLVKKIYPECFEYEDNDINVKYYDFTVNNLTKDFIIEKETYKNLLYGEDVEKDELQSELYKKANDLINNDVNCNWQKYMKSLFGNGIMHSELDKYNSSSYQGEGVLDSREYSHNELDKNRKFYTL